MQLSKLYIDENVAHSKEALSIQSYLGISSAVINDIQEIYSVVRASEDPVKKGKSILYLTENKGTFVKRCPGTKCYRCCGYKVMSIGMFCSMDCSYCILQTYFHPPLLQFYINWKDLWRELDDLFKEPSITRIGTGEFTDSLIWEDVCELNELLIEKFSSQSSAVLELKTKTTSIEKIKSLNHNKKTIIAWSVNTESVIRTEERQTSSLSERLEAAAKCQSYGYPIAFHFDPMIIYDGCEEEYRQVIHQIFSSVSLENIVWISLGSFRFMPGLKGIIENRFKNSTIVYGEFISGMDGKMRYFKPIRIELYRKIVTWIKEIAPDLLVYLCMEDDEVWQKAFGFTPSDYGGLSRMLDKKAIKHCGLNPLY